MQDLNDVATLAGVKRTPLVIGGETYDVYPLTIEDYGELQNWLDTQYPDPLAIAAEEMRLGRFNHPQQQFLLRTAMELKAKARVKIGSPEASEQLQSVEGTTEALYLSIRRGRPSFTREEATALFNRLTLAELASVFAATNLNMVMPDPPKAPGIDGESPPG